MRARILTVLFLVAAATACGAPQAPADPPPDAAPADAPPPPPPDYEGEMCLEPAPDEPPEPCDE